MRILENINYAIAIFFVVCYAYQYFYIIWSIFKKPKIFTTSTPHRFAILISARNEQSVIGHLIDSIKAQDYPAELIDTYVVADNCTDNTASVARKRGATVYERSDLEKIGKGYALNFLFKNLYADRGRDYYDAFIIVDADNLLDKSYVTEMNKTYSNGYKVITSHRNSKNYKSNWVSSGYALWFLREAVNLNNPRMTLHTSCAVSGTGFLFDKEIAKRNDGWSFYLLTEDIEFTIDTILNGEKIGYCHTAILYDEQPETFKQSWHQRIRWSKGYLQVFGKYGWRLFRGMFGKNGFSCFDMTMTILPAIVLGVVGFVSNVSIITLACITQPSLVPELLLSLGQTLLNAYLMLLAVGIVTALCDRKQLKCPIPRLILSLFTFPLFMFTYIPISFAAIFVKVKWKHIDHTCAVSVEQMK